VEVVGQMGLLEELARVPPAEGSRLLSAQEEMIGMDARSERRQQAEERFERASAARVLDLAEVLAVRLLDVEAAAADEVLELSQRILVAVAGAAQGRAEVVLIEDVHAQPQTHDVAAAGRVRRRDHEGSARLQHAMDLAQGGD